MQDFLVSILLGFSTILGVQNLPTSTGDWNVESRWASADGNWILKANNSNLKSSCSPGKYLVFPQVTHGIHKVYADQKLIYTSGDATFQTTSAFYERGVVACDFVAEAKEVTWTVQTYSKYFARIKHMPTVASSRSEYFFQDVVVNIVAAGCLLILALFSVFIFRGRVRGSDIASLAIGSVALAIYAALTCGNYIGLNSSMLTIHKIADVSVWVGSFAYIYFFRNFNFLGKVEFYSFLCAFLVGELLIIFGGSADVVQEGTTIPIPFAFICMLSFLIRAIMDGFNAGFNKNSILGIISITSFVAAGCNDLLHILGVIDTNMLMPVGSVFGVFFLAASVNQDIEKTYLERDDLVSNLQTKVEEQTRHLSSALDQVKKSQAELVQSARLASLGTLSAGIAHEINNAINFVNGAVIPLERKVMKSIPEGDRVITEKLFAAIKEGTHLTVEIVRSLRNFTGLNQAKVKDVNLKETLVSVLTILKSKMSHIEIRAEISDSLVLNCYQVGLNQIFMNLISNAIDVMPASGGKITVVAIEALPNNVEIRISDNGHGMSNSVKERIFDPFYTTKEVGKGTGLGLHIVQKEVERHAGTITVESEVNVGTTFVITLPKNSELSILKVAS